MPPGFATHHPEGMADNSPTFQRWEPAVNGVQVPKGRLTIHAVGRPFGTYCAWVPDPNVETLVITHKSDRSIPKGLCNIAQGCEERATLGNGGRSNTTLKGLRRRACGHWANRRNDFDKGCDEGSDKGARGGKHEEGTTLSGLRKNPVRLPRVARSSQPWALLRNPFGIQRPARRKIWVKTSVETLGYCHKSLRNADLPDVCECSRRSNPSGIGLSSPQQSWNVLRLRKIPQRPFLTRCCGLESPRSVLKSAPR
jgi:hypothetical protein